MAKILLFKVFKYFHKPLYAFENYFIYLLFIIIHYLPIYYLLMAAPSYIFIINYLLHTFANNFPC